MADINGSTTSSPKYFEQHELGDMIPNDYEYEHTRAILIHLDPVFHKKTERFLGLSPRLQDAYRTDKYPGVPRKDKSWYDVTKEFLLSSAAVRTKFDFQIWFKSRIVILLADSFWQFSRTLDPFTTKQDYGGQYFDLLFHRLKPPENQDEEATLISQTPELWRQLTPDEPCRCISFYTQRPMRDIALGGPQVFHGFSMNVELLTVADNGKIDYSDFLPMTIDPDIENKGGNPGP